jgi:signal peptidase II
MNVKDNNNSTWQWLILSSLIILADQFSKYWAQQYFVLDVPVPVFSWLNFTLAFNPGAAFRFLGDSGFWRIFFLSGLSFFVSLYLIVWLLRSARSQMLLCFSLSLIIGGAIGNLIDRLRFGYVVDCIDFHIGNWHFATFNVADSAISVGAFFLIIKLVLGKKA